MTKKDGLSPQQQQATIKKVYGDFYTRIHTQDWLGAFLIAFGLVENRINTMDRAEREFRQTNGTEPATNLDKHRPFRNQVNYLERHDCFHPQEAEEIRQIGDVRNQVVHDLVWAAHEVNDKLCFHTLDLERKAKNARYRQKRRHKRTGTKLIRTCSREFTDPAEIRMATVQEVAQLQTLLKTVEPYPAGTCPVPETIPGTAFFPGGQGLWYQSSQTETPVFPAKRIMIVGQDYYTVCAYKMVLEQSQKGDAHSEGKTKTWINLCKFLNAVEIPQEDCFFTNLFMGLRTEGKPTGKFPGAKDAGFVARCLDFFEMQVRVQQPKLILTLGNIVPRYLARRAEKLDIWRSCQTLTEIDTCGPVVHPVAFQGVPEHQCAVVALTHPSMRPVNVGRRRYQNEQGNKAEIKMVQDGLVAVS